LLVENVKAAVVTKKQLLGPFMEWLLYFGFKQPQITARNSFAPEVQNISRRGGTNPFSISWKCVVAERSIWKSTKIRVPLLFSLLS
jgi:hypothetical protein